MVMTINEINPRQTKQTIANFMYCCFFIDYIKFKHVTAVLQ